MATPALVFNMNFDIFNDSERWSFPSQQKRPLIWLEQRWRCWRVMMGHLAGPSHQSTVNAPSSWGPALQKSSRRGWAPYVRHSSLLKSTAPMHVLCNNKTISFFFHHRDCIVFYTVLFYFLLEMTKKMLYWCIDHPSWRTHTPTIILLSYFKTGLI